MLLRVQGLYKHVKGSGAFFRVWRLLQPLTVRIHRVEGLVLCSVAYEKVFCFSRDAVLIIVMLSNCSK